MVSVAGVAKSSMWVECHSPVSSLHGRSPSVLEQQPRRTLESFREQCAAQANQRSFLPGYLAGYNLCVWVPLSKSQPRLEFYVCWSHVHVWGQLRLYLGPSRIRPNHVTLVLPS